MGRPGTCAAYPRNSGWVTLLVLGHQECAKRQGLDPEMRHCKIRPPTPSQSFRSEGLEHRAPAEVFRGDRAHLLAR